MAVIGDSTFMHSGLTGLVNVVYNGGKTTTLILDNTLQQLTCDNVTLPLNPILTEGQHTIKIQPNAESAGFPIVDCLYVTEKNVPTAESEDRVFEAEEATFNALGGLKSSPVRISRAGEGFQGPGYVTGLARKVSDGAGLRFVVPVRDNGYYNLTVRYRAGADARLGVYLRNTALSLYNKVKDVPLETTELTSGYLEQTYPGEEWANREPRVLRGSSVTGDNFWKGKYGHNNALLITQKYGCTDPYAITDMEDIAVCQAADSFGMLDRLIILRDSVNMDVFAPGVTPEKLWGSKSDDELASDDSDESFDIFATAMENNYKVGRIIIEAILNDELE